LSDVRRTDARSAEITNPDGVTRCFHVRLNKVEPSERVRACNLFAKNQRRFSLGNEVVPCGPQVPLVIKRTSLACRAERFRRGRGGPLRHQL
jgi:hypothetical protein